MFGNCLSYSAGSRDNFPPKNLGRCGKVLQMRHTFAVSVLVA